MPPATDLLAHHRFSGLIFGRYKMGKTEGAATFPRPNFICTDPDGMDTLMSPGFRSRHPEVDLSQVHYEYFRETTFNAKGLCTAPRAFDDCCRYFDACMTEKGAEWKSPHTGKVYKVSPEMFDTWVLDSLSTLIKLSNNKAIKLLNDPSFAGKALSHTYAAAERTGLVVLKQQDFGAERSQTEQFVRMLIDSGKHIVVLAHEREHTNEAGTVTEITPLVTGQSVEHIPLMFSNVCRLRAQKDGPNLKRYLEVKPAGTAQVGSRLEIPDRTEWNWPAIRDSLRLTSN